MKKWHKISLSILVILVIVTTLAVVFWPPALRVQADEYMIMLQMYSKQPPTLDIVFNPTGTHIHRGYLNIRLDFYPDEDDKSYTQSLYQTTLDEWIVTPCLTHFIKVPTDITAEKLTEYILSTFYADVTATIDDILIQKNSSHLLSPFMREKIGLPAEIIDATSKPALISSVNSRLETVSIVSGEEPATPFVVVPESIDVGAAADPRASYTYDDYTYFGLDNPANATGTIDTIDFYVEDTLVDFFVGTLYADSPPTYTCREGSGDLGVFAAGLRQVTGLTIDIETGDYIGTYSSDSSAGHPIERDTSGFAGVLYSGAGNFVDTSDSTTYSTAAGDAISLRGTGEEAGGDPSLTNTPDSKAFGVVAASSTYWSNGSEPSWDLTDGDAYFTITNDGSIAIDIDIYSTDFDGGGGWNLVTGSPGSGEARLLAYKEGDGSTDNITILNTQTLFISSLAASANIDWELRMDVSTVSDKYQHSANITLEASAS